MQLIILVSLLLSLPSYIFAKDSSIIIFDASGSMKKEINGQPKIDIARDVMGHLIQDWNMDIDLGLMVYGHRTKLCNDIELLVPVKKLDPSKLLDSIKNIYPNGKTPIGESLQQAAKILNYIEDPTTLILISDGEENCQSDPCSISKNLEKEGINFTTYVIGFNIISKSKAYSQLKCIADSTGGKFFEAKDYDSLSQALKEIKEILSKPKIKIFPIEFM